MTPDDSVVHDALREVEPESHVLEDDGIFPNNSELPVLLYRGAFELPQDEDEAAEAIEEVFGANDWAHGWRDGVYDFAHYHSTAHEVLGCYSGRARLRLGGDHGLEVELERGDVVVLPAGVSHERLSQSEDFAVVGSYPEGQDYDMNLGKDGERPEADENIERVPMPDRDPLYGSEGPLVERWG